MNAPNTARSILDYVSLKKKSELCRFVFFGSTRLATDELLKFFGKYARENFADGAITGLMLVYPNLLIHLMESSEQEIFQACSRLMNFEPKMLGICKYFPMEMSVGADERFFDKWYCRKVIMAADGAKLVSGINNNDDFAADLESFEQVTNTYGSLMKSLYALYRELREAKTKSHSCLMERLEQLAITGNQLLPEEKILKGLLESSWGENLEKLVDTYWNGITISWKAEMDDIWPFPEINDAVLTGSYAISVAKQ